MTKTYQVNADAGCVAIESGGLRAMFSNGIGDGTFHCHVLAKRGVPPGLTFETHFEVQEPGAHLLDYDCGGNPIHTFGPGRYGVFHDDDGNTFIEPWG